MKLATYATDTTVSPAKSQAEIQELVQRYGATKFAFATSEEMTMIAFQIEKRQIRFTIVPPPVNEFALTPQGKRRNAGDMKTAHQKYVWSLWRSLVLTIKAKLESVSAQIETVEQAFLPQIVLPNNETVSEWITPHLKAAYENNTMPPLLGSGI